MQYSRPLTQILGVMALAIATTSILDAQPGGGPGGGGPPPPPPLQPLAAPLAPPENPVTADKAMLGKILFWDEQLSSDSSVACATCHIPEFGGSDPRSLAQETRHVGPDGLLGTADDIFGSLGIVKQDSSGNLVADPVFGNARQVTGRKTPSFIMAAYSDTLFWDGRVGPSFVDPQTNALVIATRGALEAQAVGPLVSDVEMACLDRPWEDLIEALEVVEPLALASNIPAAMVSALQQSSSYPLLFQSAFGTPEINVQRIAFALATYQRTLIPNQSPFDNFIAQGPSALTPLQNQGNQVFVQNCLPCHGGNTMSDNNFHNVGVRPPAEDPGRQGVTGVPQDLGRFRTPSLRNVALRAPYFHNGGKATLGDVITHYNNGGEFLQNLSPLIDPLGLNAGQRNALREFLETALTDPRVAQGLPPFDHPDLQTYFRRGDANRDDQFDLTDPIALLQYLFLGGTVACRDAADGNDNGSLELADAIVMLSRMFAGGPMLAAPSDITVGPDPTADLLGCDE